MLLLGGSLLISAHGTLQGTAPPLLSILALITTEHQRIGLPRRIHRGLSIITANGDS